jgi:hypothetical protein
MRNTFRSTFRATVLALLAVVALAGCNKDAGPAKSESAPVAMPKDGDPNQWQAYANDVVKRNMDGVTNSPFVYFLPEETTADFQAQYDSQLEKVQGDITRGILEGNMLAFISPASAKMADLVMAAFADVEPTSMKGVKVVFIGQPADGERVKAAVTPTGVNYVFVEAK